MSRIGKQPVVIPDKVEVKLDENRFSVKGPKGELGLYLHKDIKVEVHDKEITIQPKDEKKKQGKALWGTFRMLIANSILGVTEGYQKELEINGTGYRASVSGKKLVMELGYSHPIEIEAPEGIAFEVNKNIIKVSGIDKQLVGEVAAKIRSKRKVEPYKGKGIKYVGEFVRRKAGKKAGGEGGA